MRSLREQLTRELLGVVSALVGCGVMAVAFTARQELVESFDGNLRTRALAVAALSEWKNGKPHFEFSHDFLGGFEGDHAHHLFEVRAEDGTLLARSPSALAGELPSIKPEQGAKPRYRNFELPDDHDGRLVALSFTPRSTDRPPGAPPLQVIVASDRGGLDETLNALLLGAGGCCALLLAGVLWSVPRVLRRGLAPLAALADRAAGIDANSLATRFPATGLPAELSPIAARLNELLSRLEQSFERERRFAADLAHELRTPLAELRNAAECAIKWPETRDPGIDRDVLAIAKQMEGLVERMLTLARSEQGQMAVRLVPLDAAPLAREAWRPFAERAAIRRISARFDLEEGETTADPALLRSILGNLFDNAVAYAPVESVLHIGGAKDGRGYRYRVSNLPGELTPQDLPRLFERFWRKESARGGEGEHVGLGLALAKAFAAAMGWTLEAGFNPSGWVVFTLSQSAEQPGWSASSRCA